MQSITKSAKEQEKGIRIPLGKRKEKSQAVQNAEKSIKEQEKGIRVPLEKKNKSGWAVFVKISF